MYDATATQHATTIHGTSTSLFMASFHWPTVLNCPNQIIKRGTIGGVFSLTA
jgi:hypothetical protein